MLDAQLTEYAIKGLEAELATLDARRASLAEQLQTLRGRRPTKAPKATNARTGTVKKRARPVMSEEGRQRIAEAQRRRWAASRAQQDAKKATPKATPKAAKPTATKKAPDLAEQRLAARLERLAKARQAKAAKRASAAPAPPEREIARPPMPRHVRKQRPAQSAEQAQA